MRVNFSKPRILTIFLQVLTDEGFYIYAYNMVEGEEIWPYSRLGPKVKDKEYALTADRLANKSVIHQDKISVFQEVPDGKQARSQL